jgi:hypothetical protein
MHGDAVECLVGGRQQARDRIVMLLAQHVEHPRRIFTGRPRGQDLHDVSARAFARAGIEYICPTETGGRGNRSQA